MMLGDLEEARLRWVVDALVRGVVVEKQLFGLSEEALQRQLRRVVRDLLQSGMGRARVRAVLQEWGYSHLVDEEEG